MFTFVHIFYNLIGRLATDGQDFFTSYDEVCESFDAMGLQENLLRGIYAYGNYLETVFKYSQNVKVECLLTLLIFEGTCLLKT